MVSKSLVVLIVTREAQFGFEGNGERESAVDALVYGVLRRVDRIVYEFQHEIFAGNLRSESSLQIL